MPEKWRRRVLGDPGTLDLYADLLRGDRKVSGTWHRYVALCYLAESGNAKYVPLFLDLAGQDSVLREGSTLQIVTYGLARNASLGAAAERLRALTRLGPAPRERVVVSLFLVNDTVTRALLREVPRDRMSDHQRRLVDAVLATPALARGEGRFACSRGESFGKAADGRFRCWPEEWQHPT